jgi:exodeoxyribonuclease V alpha subunit
MMIQDCAIEKTFSSYWCQKLRLDQKEVRRFLELLFCITRKGHFCLDLNHLPTELKPHKDCLKKGARIFFKDQSSRSCSPVLEHHGAYYLQRQLRLEKKLMHNTIALKHQSKHAKFSANTLDLLSSDQKEIIAFSQKNSPVFITGGPGSGKTFFAKNLINFFLESAPKKLVTIAAFTAKAAHLFAHINNPQIEIKTLHSLIKPHAKKPRKIHTDLLIIDEASMINPLFFQKLFEAILPETLVVFMGDPHQLAPIESLSVFEHLATLLKGHHFHLNGSWRSNTSIQTLSQHLLSNNKESFLKTLESDPNLELIDSANIDLLSYLKKRVRECYPEGTCHGPVNKLLILTPFAQSSRGYIKLNQQLQNELNLSFVPITIEKNESTLKLSNGQTGILIGNYAHFFFENYSRRIHKSLLPAFSPAYATSIHKSQGSSAEHCIILLDRTHDFLTQNLLYTAITRAKQRCTIISTNEILSTLIRPAIQLTHKLSSHL